MQRPQTQTTLQVTRDCTCTTRDETHCKRQDTALQETNRIASDKRLRYKRQTTLQVARDCTSRDSRPSAEPQTSELIISTSRQEHCERQETRDCTTRCHLRVAAHHLWEALESLAPHDGPQNPAPFGPARKRILRGNPFEGGRRRPRAPLVDQHPVPVVFVHRNDVAIAGPPPPPRRARDDDGREANLRSAKGR
jgi:hypothetical protein